MSLTLTRKEEAAVLRRRAAKGRQRIQGPKLQTQRAKPKGGRERDVGYMAWLHDGLSCIGCLVLGRAPLACNPIEAAHQKLQLADRGLHRKLGVRSDDRLCVPLCAYHHRLGPLCCDPAQGKFWSILGLTTEAVADFCLGLHAAYSEGRPGEPVVQAFAHMARSR